MFQNRSDPSLPRGKQIYLLFGVYETVQHSQAFREKKKNAILKMVHTLISFYLLQECLQLLLKTLDAQVDGRLQL